MNLYRLLDRKQACFESLNWLGDRSPREAWFDCPDGAWNAWGAAAVGVPARMVVRAAAGPVGLVLDCMTDGLRPEAEEALAIVGLWLVRSLTAEETLRLDAASRCLISERKALLGSPSTPPSAAWHACAAVIEMAEIASRCTADGKQDVRTIALLANSAVDSAANARAVQNGELPHGATRRLAGRDEWTACEIRKRLPWPIVEHALQNEGQALPTLWGHLESGVVYVDGSDFVGRASDGALVTISSVHDPEGAERYLAARPNPSEW